MLGLRLHRGPDTVAGWSVTHSDAEYSRLQANSRIGLTGQLVTRLVPADGVVFTTFVQLHNPVARALWARVLPAHLEIVESLVAAAVRRVG